MFLFNRSNQLAEKLGFQRQQRKRRVCKQPRETPPLQLESLEERTTPSAGSNPMQQIAAAVEAPMIVHVANATADASNATASLERAYICNLRVQFAPDRIELNAARTELNAAWAQVLAVLEGRPAESTLGGPSSSVSGSSGGAGKGLVGGPSTADTASPHSSRSDTALVNNDTLIWNPQKGSSDAAQASNWYDLTQNKQGVEAPGNTNPVIFNNNPAYEPIVNNSPIEWGQDFSLPSIQLASYTGQMTLKDGVTVVDTGNLFDSKDSWLKVFFGTNAVFQLDAGGGITNMTLSGSPSGLLKIDGGTTMLANDASYQYYIGANIYVAAGATLIDQGLVPLKLTNTNLTIYVLGTMNVFYGPSANNTLIDATGFDNDYIDVTDDGMLKYLGSGGVTDTFKNVPVFVRDGDFIVTTATNVPNSGTLIVTGTVPNQANNASVYVTGAGTSTVQLSKGAALRSAAGETLECDDGYYQDSGTLETTDATTCTLKVGATGTGTATIAGGSVKINQPNVGYGQLDVAASTLNFNGQLVVAMAANIPGTNDLLNVQGVTNLQKNATLEVFVNNGPPAPNKVWAIIKDNLNANIAGNFVMPITTIPQTALTAQIDPNAPTQYILKS